MASRQCALRAARRAARRAPSAGARIHALPGADRRLAARPRQRPGVERFAGLCAQGRARGQAGDELARSRRGLRERARRLHRRHPERQALSSTASMPFARRAALLGALNSLSQLALKIAMPGVPDFYQGTEFWDLSLGRPRQSPSGRFRGARRRARGAVGGTDMRALADAWPRRPHQARADAAPAGLAAARSPRCSRAGTIGRSRSRARIAITSSRSPAPTATTPPSWWSAATSRR